MNRVNVGLLGIPDSIGSRRKGVTGRADNPVRGARKGGAVHHTESADENATDSGKHVMPETNHV